MLFSDSSVSSGLTDILLRMSAAGEKPTWPLHLFGGRKGIEVTYAVVNNKVMCLGLQYKVTSRHTV